MGCMQVVGLTDILAEPGHHLEHCCDVGLGLGVDLAQGVQHRPRHHLPATGNTGHRNSHRIDICVTMMNTGNCTVSKTAATPAALLQLQCEDTGLQQPSPIHRQ